MQSSIVLIDRFTGLILYNNMSIHKSIGKKRKKNIRFPAPGTRISHIKSEATTGLMEIQLYLSQSPSLANMSSEQPAY